MRPAAARAAGRQGGAALLTAMVTLTLVATLATAALWQHWRGVEIETAERNRAQMQWVLNGALDWARLILQEDARNGSVDHLSEPWALALQEARLSSFLAQDRDSSDQAMEAFLSGQISDQQGLLNLRNLVQDGQVQIPALLAFGRLFDMLGLPRGQLQQLVAGLQAADTPAASAATRNPATVPLKPQLMHQLAWLGLPVTTLQALQPYATLLPRPTALNLNTAHPVVISAALSGVDLARAQQMVRQRATGHFKTVDEALQAAGLEPGRVDAKDLAVGSLFFTVRGRLRLGAHAVQEVSLLERSSGDVQVLWRQREAIPVPGAASLQ